MIKVIKNKLLVSDNIVWYDLKEAEEYNISKEQLIEGLLYEYDVDVNHKETLIKAVKKGMKNKLEGYNYIGHKFTDNYRNTTCGNCLKSHNARFDFKDQNNTKKYMVYVKVSYDYSIVGRLMVGEVYLEIIDYKLVDDIN